MPVTPEDLILCAEALIQSTDPIADRIVKIESYSKDFDLWYASIEAGIGKEHAKVVEKLLALHNELISAAEVWLKEAGKDIGKHKQKSKVIMAYADVLPKRVSRYRTKKG